jgi:NAD(P)H-hydrate epimerase
MVSHPRQPLETKEQHVPKIVTVEQMKTIEKAADESGLTFDQMMENAGRAVAEAVRRRQPALNGKRVVVLVGSGNNGGDGLVAVDQLAETGAQIAAYLIKARDEADPHLARVRARGALVAVASEDQRARVLHNLLGAADVVIDAVLGTGFKLPLEGPAKGVLAAAKKAIAARSARPFVVAVDCPSGLDCDTGELADEALPADLTVTLAAAKPGHFHMPGAAAVGELSVADIGIPEKQKELSKVPREVASTDELRSWLPERPLDAHKGTFGRVIVVAGSVNFPGAASLAGLGAYRIGAGLVTLATPSSLQSLIAPRLPEATWILLPHELGAISADASEVLKGELSKADAFLLGPGFGQDPTTGAFLDGLLLGRQEIHRPRIGFIHREQEHGDQTATLPPCVVDADGLKLLAGMPDWPSRLPALSILTPHPGEMAVLTGEEVKAIQADRMGTASKWAAEWGHVVVLKGAFTVVADPAGRTSVIPIATPALARAGTGDVLAGAIVGLRGQGLDAFRSAVLGAYLHARAGQLAALNVGSAASVIAGDVAEALAAAIAGLVSGRIWG